MRALADLPGPRGLPLIGNAHQLHSKQLHLTFERWCTEHGRLFHFRIGTRDYLGLGDRDEIAALLRDRPDTFSRLGEFASILPELGIDGVFNAEGDAWRRQRRLAVTALNANHLNRYYAVIHRAAERLHGRLTAAAGDGVDIAGLFGAYTVDVTSSLAFGHDIGEGDHELRRHVSTVFAAIGRRVAAPAPYWRWVRLPKDRAADRSVEHLRRAVADFIERARQRMRERPELQEHPENFLESLLAAPDRYSHDELHGNTLTMLLAGEDTTSETLAWTSYLLARQPAIQQRLAEEARALLGDTRVPADYATASTFAYGEAVLREAIRVKPVVPFMGLEALRDVDVAGVAVPAGTRVMVMTRHATLSADGATGPPWPETLEPEAWLEGRREPNQLMGFGAGPRFCPGRNLALLEAKTALAVLAGGFELTPAPGEVTERFAFTTVPEGLRLNLRPRG